MVVYKCAHAAMGPYLCEGTLHKCVEKGSEPHMLVLRYHLLYFLSQHLSLAPEAHQFGYAKKQ